MAQVPKSCFCCNVKVGTIALAFLFMIVGIGGIVVISYALVHPYIKFEYLSETVADNNQSWNVFYSAENSASIKWISLAVSILVCLIGCSAIVGVAKNKHGYLSPLIVLQVLIILRSFITLCNVIFNWSTIRLSIALLLQTLCTKLPKEVQNWLLNLNDQALAAVIYGLLFLGLLVKFYLFSMTYKCYNHIKAEQQQENGVDVETAAHQTKSDEFSEEKLPQYSDIHKFPLVDVKPPPYSA